MIKLRKKAYFIIIFISLSVFSSFVFFIAGTRGVTAEIFGVFSPQRLTYVAGQDGCTPIKVSDDYYVWTFGDTILGEWKDQISLSSTFESGALFKGMISNSIARTPNPANADILNLPFIFYSKDNNVTPLISDKLNSGNPPEKHWPVGGAISSGFLYVFSHSITLKNTGKLELIVNGTLLSKINIKSVTSPQFTPVIISTKKFFASNEPLFGDNVYNDNGLLLVSGRGSDKNGAHTLAYLAICPENLIEKREAYSFYSGNEKYTNDLGKAVPIIEGVVGEFSFTYNKFLQKYIAVYCNTTGDITLKIFKTWPHSDSAITITAHSPDKLNLSSRPFAFYYSAKEIYTDQNHLYVVYMNPAIYQPVLIKITIESLRNIIDKKFI